MIFALLIIAVLVFMYVASAVRLIRPYQRGVLERLGKYHSTLDPGLRFVIPVVDKLRIVDMREQVVDVPPQEVITEDNVVVSVDAVVYYEPTDPQRLVYNVANFILAVTKLAQTNLRNLIGDMDLDQALTSREIINAQLRSILDEATDKWGVRVVRVEIQRIDPPPDVMASMHEQMKAERTRRATVLQAEGQREAAIAKAEGEKRSAILTAEGRKEAAILEAEGRAKAIERIAEAERYRQQVVAEGQAQAIVSVYKAIHEGRPTEGLLAVKYLDALAQIANGQATKIFLPTEASGILGAIGSIAELLGRSVDGGAPGSASQRIPDAAEGAQTRTDAEENGP